MCFYVSALCNNMSLFATRVGCGSVWQLVCSVVCDRICVEVLGGALEWLCLCVLSRIAVSFQRSIESRWSILGFRPHCSQLHCVNSALYWWLKHNSIFPNCIVLFHDSHLAIFQTIPSNSCTKKSFLETPYGFKLAEVPYRDYMKTISSIPPPTASKKKQFYSIKIYFLFS